MTMARPLLTRFALSALSGTLLALTMPGIDMGWLAWVALVPLLIALDDRSASAAFGIALPFGLIWAISAHRWYPFVLGPSGFALMVLVGFFYAALIQLGVWLRGRVAAHAPSSVLLGMLALPLAWTAGEFLRYAAPVTGTWWFALLANSQWQNPPALQVLTLTGLPGLAFMLMLVNVALAHLVRVLLRRKTVTLEPIIALTVVGAIVGWGYLTIAPLPPNGFTVVATVDLANTDPAIQASGEADAAGYQASTPAQSQAIFAVNAALTRSARAAAPAFVVWPEHEIAAIDDTLIRPQLATLARELQTYLVVDMVWQTPTGKYDTALLIGPDGTEIGRQAKINITDGERAAGFQAGPSSHQVFTTPYGRVGLGVCWDRHITTITRRLAQQGAQIVLMPDDSDFGTPWFPPYHAADSVFRAVENRVAFALGSVSGIAQVIDPYGRMSAQSSIDTRQVIAGTTFVLDERTLYTRWGDWFGWLTVGIVVILIGLRVLPGRARRSSQDHAHHDR